MDVIARGLETHPGGHCALAVVVATRGSVPRHPGSMMIVGPDGSLVGTIGGGRIELECTRAGIEVAGGAPGRMVSHHLVRDLAMCCGGSMDVLVVPLAGAVDRLTGAVDRWRQRRPFTVEIGLEGVAVSDGVSEAPRWDGAVFRLPVWPAERVVLFGAGHVARAIGPLAARVGFEVAVCDDDETGALSAPLDWADARVDSFDIPDVSRALGELGRGDFVLVLTRDHAIDQRLVEKLIGNRSITYLGLIGSLGKIGRFRKRIFAKGLADEQSWARLRAPIGLDIAAETPDEIAVSVIAELIAERARLRGLVE